MKCNTSKCKELAFRKKRNTSNYPAMYNIEQYEHLTLLGVTTQFNWAFSLHVKAKLCEANKCLFIIRGLRREGYSQYEIDLLFKAIVLAKLTYGLPVYGASEADLNVIQFFLKRCFKRDIYPNY